MNCSFSGSDKLQMVRCMCHMISQTKTHTTHTHTHTLIYSLTHSLTHSHKALKTQPHDLHIITHLISDYTLHIQAQYFHDISM